MGVWSWLGKKTLKVLGWKLVGNIPDDVKKCVIAVAPHTSIDDFILGRLAYCSVPHQKRVLRLPNIKTSVAKTRRHTRRQKQKQQYCKSSL